MANFTIVGWLNCTHYIGSHASLTFEDGEISGALPLIEKVREVCGDLKDPAAVEAAARLFLTEAVIKQGLAAL